MKELLKFVSALPGGPKIIAIAKSLVPSKGTCYALRYKMILESRKSFHLESGEHGIMSVKFFAKYLYKDAQIWQNKLALEPYIDFCFSLCQSCDFGQTYSICNVYNVEANIRLPLKNWNLRTGLLGYDLVPSILLSSNNSRHDPL